MAGSPTKLQTHTMFKNGVDVMESVRGYGNGTLLTKIDTLETALKGIYPPPQMTAVGRRVRSAVASASAPALARAMLEPVAREYGRLAVSPFATSDNLGALLDDVYLYWDSESDTVNSRDITYATPAADGSNTGDGLATRLTVDAKNYSLEAVRVELKTLECSRDQSLGTRRHAEQFRAFGVNAGVDILDLAGSGSSGPVQFRHAGTDRKSGSLLRNASFQTYDGTGTPKFDAWTEDSGAGNLSQDTTTYFRSLPDESTGHSLKISGAAVISQQLSASNTELSRNVPYGLRVMFNRAAGAGVATLRIRLGSQTITVALAAQTGWNELTLPLDQNSWFENFNQDGLKVTVELESYTSGYVLVDDLVLTPLTLWDGTWLFPRGGATAFLAASAALPEGDRFTWTDTGGALGTATLQFWWYMAFSRYLPSATGAAETVTDP